MFTRKLKSVELEIDGLKDVEDVEYGVDIKLCHWVPKVPFVMRRIDFTIVYFYLKYEK